MNFAAAFAMVDSFCLSRGFEGYVKWGEIRRLFHENTGIFIPRKLFRRVVRKLRSYGRFKVRKVVSNSGHRNVPTYSISHRRAISYAPSKTLPLGYVLLPILIILLSYVLLR